MDLVPRSSTIPSEFDMNIIFIDAAYWRIMQRPKTFMIQKPGDPLVVYTPMLAARFPTARLLITFVTYDSPRSEVWPNEVEVGHP